VGANRWENVDWEDRTGRTRSEGKEFMFLSHKNKKAPQRAHEALVKVNRFISVVALCVVSLITVFNVPYFDPPRPESPSPPAAAS